MSSAKGFQHYVLYHGLVLTRTILNNFKKQNLGKRLCRNPLTLFRRTSLKPFVPFVALFCLLLPWPFSSSRIKTISSCNTTFSDHLWGFHPFNSFLFRDMCYRRERQRESQPMLFDSSSSPACFNQQYQQKKRGRGGLCSSGVHIRHESHFTPAGRNQRALTER